MKPAHITTRKVRLFAITLADDEVSALRTVDDLYRLFCTRLDITHPRHLRPHSRWLGRRLNQIALLDKFTHQKTGSTIQAPVR